MNHAPLASKTSCLHQARVRFSEGHPVWDLFEHRVRTHHEASRALPARPLPGAEGQATLEAACQAPRVNVHRAIYLHTPYCPAICSFCAFFRQPRGSADLDSYVDAMVAQIERFGNTAWATADEVDALYFGGGTPTVLSADHFERLLAKLREVFPVASDAEITVESRCHGTTLEFWKRLRSAGVNRVSLGVQSFDTKIRRHVGRFSSSEEITAIVAALRAARIPCLSADLIYNLPGQTAEIFDHDLQRVDQLAFDGTSIYCLIPFERSTLMQHIRQGKEPPLGGPESEFAFFSAASRFFARRGNWKRVSPVHFATGSLERNAYNSVRAGSSDVLGIGCGAGSRLGTVTFMNHMTVEKYLESQHRGESGAAMVFENRPLPPALELLRSLPESLRYTPPSSQDPAPAIMEETLEGLASIGLLSHRGRDWSMTEEGCFWSYNVASIINGAIHQALSHTSQRKDPTMETTAQQTHMEKIKAGIWDIHEGVTAAADQPAEERENIMNGTLPRYKYVNNLKQRYLLQREFEAVLASHRNHPFVAAVVTDEQFHADKAAEDLRFFGVDPRTVAPLPATLAMIAFFHATANRDPRLLLAIHYVLEGSNNGALFIAKAVRKAFQLEGTEGTLHLQPYGSAIREKWKAFGQAFNALEIDQALMTQMIATGRNTFHHMNAIGSEAHAQPEET